MLYFNGQTFEEMAEVEAISNDLNVFYDDG